MLGFVSFICVVAVCVAAYATYKGGLAWAHLPNRKTAAAALAAAMVATGVVGSAAQPQAERVSLASGASSSSGASSATSPATSASSESPGSSDTDATASSSVTVSTSASASADSTTTTPAPTTQSPARLIAHAQPRTALAVLGTLAVKGRAPKTGYSRAQFGPAWTDTDRNGCDTRNDILRRDLVHLVIKAGTYGCKVLAGDAAPEKYTGRTVHFVYGGASELDIDHVVALGDAWQKGAQQWAASKRLAFANDPLNLLAVDASANRQKGDGDAATWLPANKSFRCSYVARQVGVKAKYRLSVTAAERDAIARVLASCPGQAAPTGGNPTTAAVRATTSPTTSAPRTTAPAPRTTTSVPRTTTTRTTAPSNVYYKNCTAARAAGAAPLYAGEPGYRSGLDRDHDGVACE